MAPLLEHTNTSSASGKYLQPLPEQDLADAVPAAGVDESAARVQVGVDGGEGIVFILVAIPQAADGPGAVAYRGHRFVMPTQLAALGVAWHLPWHAWHLLCVSASSLPTRTVTADTHLPTGEPEAFAQARARVPVASPRRCQFLRVVPQIVQFGRVVGVEDQLVGRGSARIGCVTTFQSLHRESRRSLHAGSARTTARRCPAQGRPPPGHRSLG